VKIRHKLTLYFSAASSIIILVFGLSVYFFSAQYRKNEFFQRLKKRVNVAEKIFLEREKFSEEDFDKIRQQFLNFLPDETEEVVSLKASWRDSVRYNYPTLFLADLAQNEEAVFYNDTIQGAGKVFHLEEGSYAVIITAIDKVGMRVLSNLLTIIIMAMAGSIIIITLLSRYISNMLMWPIARKIQKANNISVSNLHERLIVYNPNDELGELAIAFNNLLNRLEEAFTMQKLFVANASHEIRNPLTTIMGEADVALERERSTREYQESLKAILQEAERLNNLVNNLLQLSAVSYNADVITRENISVLKLVNESKQKFDLLEPENRVHITIDQELLTKPVRVNGNKNLLETAIINIIDNASKFSSGNAVEVHAYIENKHVKISVKDSGVGISPDDIPKITQPFFRAENVRQIRGTGIGIPLTVRILEMHKGKMLVNSEVNKGTTVTIMLPLVELK
jgi:signal transduction histidine kinase